MNTARLNRIADDIPDDLIPVIRICQDCFDALTLDPSDLDPSGHGPRVSAAADKLAERHGADVVPDLDPDTAYFDANPLPCSGCDDSTAGMFYRAEVFTTA